MVRMVPRARSKSSRVPEPLAPTFGHQPVLDGVRAVAVTLVLLFHSGLTSFTGGYLGVSVFFTLSGYLITSLLLTEHARSGKISLSGFYTRRMRRLLPASTLCVALIMAARAPGAFARVDGLPSDATGALLQVFNWVTLAKGNSYSQLFLGGTSPFAHYWSLAIEEQFYWLWPLVLFGLLKRAPRRLVGRVVAALLLILSLSAIGTAHWFGPDAAYWATPARLPEILAGAVLAFILIGGHVVPARARWLAGPSLGLIVLLCMRLPADRGPAYQGALPLFGLLSAVLIYSLQTPGFVRAVLSTRPLLLVGRVSYGLYLFHWPVFLLLRERNWDLTAPAQLAVAVAITASLAALSYRFVETPVRNSRLRPWSTVRLAAAATALALLATSLIAPSESAFPRTSRFAKAVAILPGEPVKGLSAGSFSTPGNPDETAVALGPAPERPVRILLIGDSTLQSLTAGLQQWASIHPDQARVSGLWAPGLAFLRTGKIVDPTLRDFADQSGAVLDNAVKDWVPALQPDVVVLMTTLSDAAPRTWPDQDGVVRPADPRYRDRLMAADSDLTATLLARVPHVVWVVPPVPLAVPKDPNPVDASQYRVQQDVMRRLVAEQASDRVGIVDLASWLESTGHAGRDWRPDGLHLPDDNAASLAAVYLGPWLVREALRG